MERLLLAGAKNLLDPSRSDVALWGEVFNLGRAGDRLMPYVLLVDRCGQIKPPYRTHAYEPFAIPSDLGGFKTSYDECCIERANELMRFSGELKKKIIIMYSGGIDSTLILTTFLKVFDWAQLRNQVIVALSLDSIAENPDFYRKYVRKVFPIVSSERLSEFFDGRHIILAGEQNDQLFGSDMVKDGFDGEMKKPYSRKYIVSLFVKHYFMTLRGANLWFNLLDYHIKTQAPCEVSTNFHFLWWFNFAFKWQPVWFRMVHLVDKQYRPNITQDFLCNQYFHFFSTDNFQKWSMVNPQVRLPTTWRNYKRVAKKLIFEFNGDQDYYQNKIKIQSFYRMFLQKVPAAAVTSTLRYIERRDFKKEEFYDPNNSFAQEMT